MSDLLTTLEDAKQHLEEAVELLRNACRLDPNNREWAEAYLINHLTPVIGKLEDRWIIFATEAAIEDEGENGDQDEDAGEWEDLGDGHRTRRVRMTGPFEQVFCQHGMNPDFCDICGGIYADTTTESEDN